MTADWALPAVTALLGVVAGYFAGRWPWRGWRTWPQFRNRKGRLWVRIPDHMDNNQEGP